MKVSTYQPNQVQSSVSRGAFAENMRIDTGLGNQVSNFAGALSDMNKRIATTEAETALVEFEREKNNILFSPETGYYNTQGRDAFDKAELTNKSIEELKRKYADQLGSSARDLFDRAATAQITRAQVDIGRHASKGLQAWEVSALEAQTENTLENAALYWNDKETMGVQNALGRQAILDAAQMQGLSQEAVNERLQTYDSMFASSAVRAATMHGSAKGKELLESFGNRIEGPEKIKLEVMISNQQAAEKTQADAQYAIATATVLNDKYAGDRGAIVAEIEKISDPELRSKTMSQAMQQFNLNKQIESEARTAAYESAEAHVLGGGTAESFQAQYPQEWLRLSAKQQKVIQSGQANATNWETFSDLMTLPKEELAKIDPNEYFDQLAPGQRSQLITAVKTAKNAGTANQKMDAQVGRTRISQTSATVEQLFGPKNKRNDEKRQRVESFYSMLDEEVAFREAEKGSPLTSEEFTNVLNGFSRKVVIERNFLPDTEMTITDIPVEDLDALNQFLRQNKIPVTADNLIKAYKQASK